MTGGNINAVQNKGKCPMAICPMAVSMHTPNGYINTVLEFINSYAQWLSQYIRPVAILI